VILIPKNTALPCQAVKIFRTAKSNQRGVKIPIVEGESHRPEDCIALGECIIRDLPPGLPKASVIEVEYRYATNGRIAVYARVPSVRYSAHVEVQRNDKRELADLATWRARLLGKIPPTSTSGAGDPATGAVDLNDRSSVLKQLDALYTRVGVAAASLALPPPLAQSRQMALTAAAALASTQAKYREAERARQAVSGGMEALRLEANLSQVKTELQQVQTQTDFAHLVLGREFVAAGLRPPGSDREIQQIQNLQRHLQG
jgi:molecular chaperone DnaK (HSP70)